MGAGRLETLANGTVARPTVCSRKVHEALGMDDGSMYVCMYVCLSVCLSLSVWCAEKKKKQPAGAGSFAFSVQSKWLQLEEVGRYMRESHHLSVDVSEKSHVLGTWREGRDVEVLESLCRRVHNTRYGTTALRLSSCDAMYYTLQGLGCCMDQASSSRLLGALIY
jgi:hypothetical protein